MKPAVGVGLAIMAVSGGFLWFLARVAQRDARIRTEYLETRCTIENATATYTPDADSTRTRKQGTWWTNLTVRYDTANGPMTSVAILSAATARKGTPGTPEIAPGFPVASQVPCWYDPEAPKDVAIERPGLRSLLALLIPLAGILGGLMAMRNGLRE